MYIKLLVFIHVELCCILYFIYVGLCVCLFLFHAYSVWINANTFIYSNIYGSKVKIFYIQFCLICDILKDRDIHTYTLNLLNCGIKTIATNFIIICCKNFWILAMHLTKSQFKNEELFVQFTNERFKKNKHIFSKLTYSGLSSYSFLQMIYVLKAKYANKT